MVQKRCPLGTRQFGLFCIRDLPKPKRDMRVVTLRRIHTVKMGKADWIDLPRIDIPKGVAGKVTYVAGIGSPEFHVRWNFKKRRPETIEEDMGQTHDEIAEVVKRLR